ncbi:hypothetical protein COCC4DRAFT_87175, partial [Bipolaris maydis ATCC 48331]|uniref:Uncharacterized protein n=2 Tax=Cochliobolus heterostrophus TaxID=5016 RepID=M2UDC6_COCH5
MVPLSSDLPQPDSLKGQPCPKKLVIRPEHVTVFHDVYCDRSIHRVRVTISQPFGSTSRIQQMDEEVTLTFKEFLDQDFVSTEAYEDTLKKMEEFDRQCCRTIHDTAIFNPKNWVRWLQSCFFSCIPTLRRSGSRRWSSISSSKPISRSPSKEVFDINEGHETVAECSTSATNNVLPRDVHAIVAVQSFYSTSKGVCGYGVLVATRSNTINLLEKVDINAFRPHERIMNQLRGLVGELAYTQLLKLDEKRIDVLHPVYCGVLPDDLPIGVGQEVPLAECTPILQAHLYNCLDS